MPLSVREVDLLQEHRIAVGCVGEDSVRWGRQYNNKKCLWDFAWRLSRVNVEIQGFGFFTRLLGASSERNLPGTCLSCRTSLRLCFCPGNLAGLQTHFGHGRGPYAVTSLSAGASVTRLPQ